MSLLKGKDHAHSPETRPCFFPGRYVLTGSGPQWTSPCSQSSWQKDRSGKCGAPYPNTEPAKVSNYISYVLIYFIIYLCVYTDK